MQGRKILPRIFILDDDDDLLQSQSLFLESRGFTVKTASTMDVALEMIREEIPDLILADLMMEHYDTGFVFCKKVRDLKGLEDVPILMQTGASKKIGFTFKASTPKEKEWMKVDEIMTKPVPPEHLLGKIEQYLSRSDH
jgi:DNA-binding response OmpR family regulator